MLDLLGHDRRQIVEIVDLAVIRKGRIDRHGDQFLVAALVVVHQQHADRAHADHRAGNDRRAGDDERVERIAILAQSVRYEAVIGRIAHRRVQDAVDEDRARFLVELIFHRLAADAAPR